jgi:hypothetical protein
MLSASVQRSSSRHTRSWTPPGEPIFLKYQVPLRFDAAELLNALDLTADCLNSKGHDYATTTVQIERHAGVRRENLEVGLELGLGMGLENGLAIISCQTCSVFLDMYSSCSINKTTFILFIKRKRISREPRENLERL